MRNTNTLHTTQVPYIQNQHGEKCYLLIKDVKDEWKIAAKDYSNYNSITSYKISNEEINRLRKSKNVKDYIFLNKVELLHSYFLGNVNENPAHFDNKQEKIIIKLPE